MIPADKNIVKYTYPICMKKKCEILIIATLLVSKFDGTNSTPAHTTYCHEGGVVQ